MAALRRMAQHDMERFHCTERRCGVGEISSDGLQHEDAQNAKMKVSALDMVSLFLFCAVKSVVTFLGKKFWA